MHESTVFVVEDDASLRAGIVSLLRAARLQVEGFASAQEFLARPALDGPCCLVLDVRLPGLSGLDLQTRLTEAGREIPIVFMTGQGDVPTSVRAMKAGAVEFLTKPFDEAALLEGIARALERSRARRREAEEVQGLRDRWDSLSPREREVMQLVVDGLLNKQIATRLGVREVTIKVHRGKVMEKMRAGSLPDLVRMATRLEPYTKV